MVRSRRGAGFGWLVAAVVASWQVMWPLAGLAQTPAPRVWLGPVDPGPAAGATLMARSLDEGVRRELSRRPAVQVTGLGESGRFEAGAADPRVEQAERLRVAAKEAFGRGEFEGALGQLRAALGLYEEGIASVNKLEAVFETLGYLGAASQALGYDADAEDFFRRVVAAVPEAEPLDEFSEAAKALFAEEKQKLLAKKRGTLRIVTVPAGARVRVDGVEMGVAPLTVPRMVRGDHYIQAEDAAAGLGGARVRVKGGGTSEVTVTLALELGPPPAEDATPEEKQALWALARAGELGEPFREMAEAVAAKARADYVVVSHLSSRGNGFVLDAFLYGVEQKQVAAFDEFVFRADLNSAAVQATRFAGAIVDAVSDFPEEKVVVGGQVAVRAPAPPPVAPPVLDPVFVEPPEPEPPPPEPPIERAPVRFSSPVPVEPARGGTEAAEEDEGGVGAWVWVVGGVAVAGGAVAAALLLSGDEAPAKRFDAEVRW